MEAGGIEPPSESASPSASTCVACILMSPRLLPQAGSHAASRHLISTLASPAVREGPARVMALGRPYGRGPVKRSHLIRQPVRSYRLQLSSPANFYEVDRAPGTQHSLLHPRRNHIAPMVDVLP